ncbi:RNA polymerase sigma factor [bacterium]|nr:RNA polymerase sigma factor [candidate division CSSED10-310 bacterium]
MAASKLRMERMYDRHAGAVHALAVRLSGFNEADALDMMQETFYRAFRALSWFRGESRELAWLRRICLNIARERWRRDQVYRHKVEPLVSERWYEGRGSDAEEKLTREVLLEALNQLPAQMREVVVLRHLEGLAPKEIARELRIAEGTVRSRLCRARRELMVALGFGQGEQDDL